MDVYIKCSRYPGYAKTFQIIKSEDLRANDYYYHIIIIIHVCTLIILPSCI